MPLLGPVRAAGVEPMAQRHEDLEDQVHGEKTEQHRTGLPNRRPASDRGEPVPQSRRAQPTPDVRAGKEENAETDPEVRKDPDSKRVGIEQVEEEAQPDRQPSGTAPQQQRYDQAVEKNAALEFQKFLLTEDVQKQALAYGLRPANQNVVISGEGSLFDQWAGQGVMGIVPRTTAMRSPDREVLQALLRWFDLNVAGR